MTKNISDIMASDLSSKASDGVDGISPMQAAVNIQKENLSSALGILSLTSGVPGLKELFNKP